MTNFVILIADDQTFESLQRMPRLYSSAASRGVFFSQAYACTPICQTARATLFTGQYSHNHHCYGNNTDYYVLDETKLLPYVLHQRGWWTGHAGKYMNTWNANGVLPLGWNDFHYMWGFYGYLKNDNGVVTTAGSAPSDYSTTVLQSKLLSMLAAATEPFFIHGAWSAPHISADALSMTMPGPDYIGSTPMSKTFPRNPDWELADVSLKPAYLQALPHRWANYSSQIDANWRACTEALYSVDRAIKAIMDVLVSTGKIDRTIIFITTDHAFLNGEQRIETGKVAPYDSAIHIPLIVAGPPSLVAQNKTCNAIVNHCDVTATILDFAGVASPVPQDGRSLRAHLTDPTTPSFRAHELTEYFGALDFNAVTNYTSVRSPDWKYTEYVTGEKELYKLRTDPYELNNVVADPANAATVAALSSLIAQGKTCSGASCIL